MVSEASAAAGPAPDATEARAREITRLTRELDAMLEPHTSAVCPACAEVCCRNRFCRHDAYDLAYLRLTSAPEPVYREDVTDTDPCQFLGEQGCTIGRDLRPFRCNWFFCSPLLEQMSCALPAPAYRQVVQLLADISRLRRSLLS
ncbi:MAG: hypothetical protein OHK006_19200 [Thermodesulfovibrionales bacterium]